MDSFTDIEVPTLLFPSNKTIKIDLNQHTAIVIWTAPVATDNSKLTLSVTCKASELNVKLHITQIIRTGRLSAAIIFCLWKSDNPRIIGRKLR